jgi:hypothetical protein
MVKVFGRLSSADSGIDETETPSMLETKDPELFSFWFHQIAANEGLQLRRANSIQAEGIKLLENHAIAPSAARLCWISRQRKR